MAQKKYEATYNRIKYLISQREKESERERERERERNIAKEKFYAAKWPIKIWKVNAGNIVISKLVNTKTNCKYLIRYLDKTIRPLVLTMPKMGEYVKTFKVKEEGNKLMRFRIDDEKLLEKYEAIWNKIDDLKNIKLNTLPVYDDRYIKTKIKTWW